MKQLVVRTSQLLPTLLKYLSAAILIFIPLYPKFPLFFLPFSTVAVRAEDFLIASAVFVLILNFILNTKKSLPPLFWQALAFFFIGGVSTISAIFITNNVQPLLVVLHWFRRLEYFFVFYLLYYTGIQGKSVRRFLFELILLPVLGVFLYGLAQIHLGAPVISTMNAEFSKGVALRLQPGVQLSSTFGGHYDLAIYLGLIILYFFVSFSFTKSNKIKTLLFSGTLCCLWLFMQAGSRIGILGLSTALFLLGLWLKNFKAAMVFIALLGLTVFSSPNLLNRMRNLLRVINPQVMLISKPVYAQDEQVRAIQADRSTSIRFDVEWPRALRSFYKNPLLGTGYSSLGLATDNDYLRSLGEAGLLGFISFILLLFGLGKGLYQRLAQKSKGIDGILASGGISIFVFFLICGIFLDVFESSKIAILFWAYTGLAFSTKNA